MRDALSLLDQSIAFGNGRVLTDDVKNMLGTIDAQILQHILQALADRDANLLLANVTKLVEQGADFSRALADLLTMLHQIAVLQAVPDAPAHVADASLRNLAKTITREDAQLYYQIGLIGQRDLPWAPSPRSGFEMTLLRMLAFMPALAGATAAAPAKPSIAATRPQPPAASPAPVTTAAANPAWHDLIQQLALDGATKMLATHCSLQELTATHLKLRLHPKQKPLLNQKHIDRIREAVSKYYNRAMAVDITVDANIQETPADLARRQQESQQQAAESAILSDPVVQHIIQNFDATVVKASIHAK